MVNTEVLPLSGCGSNPTVYEMMYNSTPIGWRYSPCYSIKGELPIKLFSLGQDPPFWFLRVRRSFSEGGYGFRHGKKAASLTRRALYCILLEYF